MKGVIFGVLAGVLIIVCAVVVGLHFLDKGIENESAEVIIPEIEGGESIINAELTLEKLQGSELTRKIDQTSTGSYIIELKGEVVKTSGRVIAISAEKEILLLYVGEDVRIFAPAGDPILKDGKFTRQIEEVDFKAIKAGRWVQILIELKPDQPPEIEFIGLL